MRISIPDNIPQEASVGLRRILTSPTRGWKQRSKTIREIALFIGLGVAGEEGDYVVIVIF